MAIISENYLSRPFTLGQQAGRELVYDILGTDDENAVLLLIQSVAPATYQGLIVESIEAEPLGGGVWKGHVRYVRFVDEAEYTFDTGGGTEHITQSIGTVARYAPAGEVAPDFKGAIGVGSDNVEGVDIPSAKFEFSETHRFTDDEMTPEYRRILFQLTACFNRASFKGLDPGECLFLGVSGSKRGDELWSLTFRFAGSPNAFGFCIGAEAPPMDIPYIFGDEGYDDGCYGDAVITGIDKLGWDYLWIRYGDDDDATAKALVKQPKAAYVERVHHSADFALLGIGE